MNAKRLLKLAEHLRKPVDERLHKRFNFNYVNGMYGGKFKTVKNIKNCGSVGCAIGESPMVFPKLIKFHKEIFDAFTTKRSACVDYRVAATELFDILYEDAEALFTPNRDRWWAIDSKNLSEKATAKQVARSIELYVKAVKEQRKLKRRKHGSK